MKKLLFSFLFLCTLNNVQAQEITTLTKNKTTFGFKGGFNQSYVSVRNIDGYQELELYGGFFSTTRLNNNWSFQSELLFSYTDDYHFIELPLLLKYHINDKWNIFLGPKLDFILDDDDDLLGEHFNPFGVSAVIGGQYNFSKKFFVEARYGYSFTDQVNFEGFYEGARRTLRIGIGYKF